MLFFPKIPTMTALILGFFIFVIGCGQISEGSENKNELDGTWVWPCAEDSNDVNFLNENDHIIELMIFNGDEFESRSDLYTAAGCETKSMSFSSIGSYVTEGESDVVSNAKNWKITVSSVVATVYSADVVSEFNQYNECGYSDWETGVQKTISGLSCTALAEVVPENVPFIKENIYLRDGESLFVGDENNSEGSRPTELKENPATKQQDSRLR